MDEVQERVPDPRGAIFITHDDFADMDVWHAEVAEIRKDSPAIWVEVEGWEPFWAVTRHRDVTEISRRSDIFINTTHSAPAPNIQYEVLDLLGIDYPSTLVHLHGAQHDKARAVTNEWFKPAAVKGLQPAIDQIAEEFADRLVDLGGRCDFATDIAPAMPRDRVRRRAGDHRAFVQPAAFFTEQPYGIVAEKDIGIASPLGRLDHFHKPVAVFPNLLLLFYYRLFPHYL